jgi:chromate transporter
VSGSPAEVFLVFLRLGLTSFGGPVAHLGYMEREIVSRRGWVDETTYADLVALCQFLPGPASSQVALSLGIERAGIGGAIAAWLGFTLPSAILLVLFALGVDALGGAADPTWIHGLRVVAVPVVALAVWGMAKSLCPDRVRGSIAIAAAIAATVWRSGLAQILVLALGAVVGWGLFRKEPATEGRPLAAPVTKRQALLAWVLFFALLAGLPLAARAFPSESLDVVDRFYRAGSLVFGGGHVVLPLLEAEVVEPGWTTGERFLAGYGAAQAVPGPLFSFAAYVGAVIRVGPGGWVGAALALGAIYLPSFLLVVGALAFWERLRAGRSVRAALRGTNAAVVGLLLAALYDPAWTRAILTPRDFALALGAFGLLALGRWPPWLVVLLTAAGGAALAARRG